MATGIERRELVQDANAKSTNLDPLSVPLNPVMRPQPSSFAKVGEAQRQLSEVLGGVSLGLDKYLDKKTKQWELEGQMRRIQGETEQQLAQTGNKFTRAGWEAMNLKIAGDDLFRNELEYIKNEGHMLGSDDYRDVLGNKIKELSNSLPISDDATREMLYATATDLFPRLIEEQVKQHNQWNRIQTIEAGRKGIVSAVETDMEEGVDFLSRDMFPNMNEEDYNLMVSSAIMDSYNIGSGKVATALLLSNPKEEGRTFTATPKTVSSLLNIIGEGESRNDYNASHAESGKTKTGLTGMTVDDVIKYQEDLLKAGKKSTAVGKYQIISGTLKELKDKLELKGDELFDEGLQDTLAIQLMKNAGLDSFMKGELKPEEFQLKLSKIWAALPKDATGAGYYDGDGLNRATIKPGALKQALMADADGTNLYNILAARNVPSDQINKILAAREAFENENARKFTGKRILQEENIIESALTLSDADLINKIREAQTLGEYGDSWSNSVWDRALAARKAALEESKKDQKIASMIQTDSVKLGTKEEQQKALDAAYTSAFNAYPDSLNPESPNYRQSKLQAMHQVFKFMERNQIVDDRLTTMLEVNTSGDIVDANGNIKPKALESYEIYLQAKESVYDPMFAKQILSDTTRTLFMRADDYRAATKSDATAALGNASAFLKEQEMNKEAASVKMSWWQDANFRRTMQNKIINETLPNIIESFSSSQGQSRWQMNLESVEKAANDPAFINSILQESARMLSGLSHWPDQEAAKGKAIWDATNKVVQKTEFIGGSLVYTRDQPSIASRIGVPDIKNGANAAFAKFMYALGPDIWEDYNNTDIYTMSQQWYSEPLSLSSIAEVGYEVLSTHGMVVQNLAELAQQKILGVPDFNVQLNYAGNVLIVHPYTNLERTQQGPGFNLPIEKLKEVADFMRTKDENGFNAWIEQQRKEGWIKKRK